VCFTQLTGNHQG